MSAFGASSANGTWKLYVVDDRPGSTARSPADRTLEVETVGAADISATAGQPYSGVVARAQYTCDSCQRESVTVNWGDGTSSASTRSGHAEIGTHTYATAGTYPLSVRVRYTTGSELTYAGSATVAAGPGGDPIPPPPPAPPAPLEPSGSGGGSADPGGLVPSGSGGGSAATASFTAPQSVDRLDRVTFDAGASQNASSYRWDVNGDGRTDVECPAMDTRMTTRLDPKTTTPVVTLTAVSPSGQTSQVSRVVSVGRIRPRGIFAAAASSRPPTPYVCEPERRPTLPADDITANGGPPAGCTGTLTFDLVEAVGCLDHVTDAKDIPAAERPVLDEAIREYKANPRFRELVLLEAGPLKRVSTALIPELSVDASDVYTSRKTVRVNGLDVEPRNGAVIVVFPRSAACSPPTPGSGCARRSARCPSAADR